MTAPSPSAPPVRADRPAGASIEARDLHKTYGQREVVRGVNLFVHGGEIVGLLGKNGAGKTTTFYMIVGLVPATHGAVLLDGRDITALPMYRRAAERAGLFAARAVGLPQADRLGKYPGGGGNAADTAE